LIVALVVDTLALTAVLVVSALATAAAPVLENFARAGPGKVYLKPELKTLGVKIPESLALYPPGNLAVGDTVVLAVPDLPSNV
jgi:hypothetical protein